ncbi:MULTISPECIES: hypothetical protein [Staphylococcus]|uniref:hypothetical protein n=1 Tax=Staphylococcus TaxID=1279 RepID=UPI000D044753|nr:MULTISPECIES: hypothetical protein [Staphylococcus]MCD8915325.1 hypothetical protein [Staphylococcus simulans]UXV34985.1 hypothetical protein MUA90_00050 [Staphylococcus sp. IVB6181]
MQKVFLAGSSLALFFTSILCFVLHALIRMSITGFVFLNAGNFLIPLGFAFVTLSIMALIAFLYVDTSQRSEAQKQKVKG